MKNFADLASIAFKNGFSYQSYGNGFYSFVVDSDVTAQISPVVNSDLSLEYPYMTVTVCFVVTMNSQYQQGLYLVHNPLNNQMRELFSMNPSQIDVRIPDGDFEKFLESIRGVGFRLAGAEKGLVNHELS